jgi:RNA polymerase sigma-70 factor (ECF subfamily)
LDDPVLTEEGSLRLEVASGDPLVDERLEKRALQQKVQGCINALDEEYREVIVLRDIQGFTYDEIRDMLKIPEGTVKSRLFRARDALKDCLKKALGEL